MGIKFSIVGLLIYLTMISYLAAFIATLARQKMFGAVAFLIGSILADVALGWRWIDTGHAPMQNMFEVFLCLGAAVYPLSLFCQKFLKTDSQASDALIGFIVLFPAGLVNNFRPDKALLMPALQSPLFIPHVSAYMLAYVILFMAAVQAGRHLLAMLTNSQDAPGQPSLAAQYEQATYRLVKLGFPLLTIGLILGAVWGKLAWGDWWNWDPKELWSLVSFLVFVGYLHVRYTFGVKLPALNSVLVLMGAVAIILTLLWVNLSQRFPGMHSYATS